MKELIDRVVEESNELAEKVDKLNVFINSPAFSTVGGNQGKLLVAQKNAMENYLDILHSRILDLQEQVESQQSQDAIKAATGKSSILRLPDAVRGLMPKDVVGTTPDLKETPSETPKSER